MKRLAPALLLLAACPATDPEPTGPSFTPGTVYRTSDQTLRGMIDRRGLIHAHSVYSHDACDGDPEIDGAVNEPCFDDFRRGLCQSQHDFVMLTDHRDLFAHTSFPDTLLYREDRGDELVERDGRPTASWAACPDGSKSLILAGAESGTMPVGLEQHVPNASHVYGDRTAESMQVLKDNGAVVLIQHTEDMSIEELVELPFDGFEMYNLHANTFLNLGGILEVLLRVEQGDFDAMPHPDLIVMSFMSEDPRYLERWGGTLARGVKRTTTMGTDCHRNSFPGELQDGERADSYRRMMVWLSNHLLVRPEADGSWDDRHLKEALKAGRLYGSFDVFGYPRGFDYHAERGEQIFEMGDEVPVGTSLVVVRPQMEGLASHGDQPVLTLRILKAIEDGFEEVASTTDETLTFTTTSPGAYRAEVRIQPMHLKPYLGEHARKLGKQDLPWVYGNAIYVR